MIWENGVKFIVMSTGLIEGGQSKCERYWPAAVGDPYFNIAGLRILNAGSKVGQGYLRTEIRVDNGTQTRKIIHYWYNTWPDHGVPKDAQKKIFPNDVIGKLLFCLNIHNSYLLYPRLFPAWFDSITHLEHSYHATDFSALV